MADVNINLNAKNNAKAAINSLTRDVSKMVASVGSKMQSLGGKLSGAGKKLGAIGLAGGAALAGMTRTFAAFDDQMAKVAALSGATGDDLEALRDKAKELGASTKFSASQAAEGMNYLAMAGFDTNEILKGIPATLSLAAAGGLELGEAADIASDVGTMFGLTADEISRVADVMAATATSANTDVRMMGESFKYFGASANLAGQSIEESSAALAILAARGMKASTAGTSLNQLFAQMVKKKKAFTELGIAIADADGNMRPMLDVMQDLGVKMEDLTQEQRLKWFGDLGVRAGRAAAMLAGAPKEEIENFRQTMEDAEGSAAKMAETMQSGVGGAGVKILSAFEGMQIAIMEGLKPGLIAAAEAIVKFLGYVTEFANNNPNFVKQFAALSAGLVALGGTLVTIGTSVKLFGMAMVGLSSVIGKLGAIIGAVFTPFGAILATVVGLLVYAVYTSGAWKDMFTALKTIAVDTLNTIKQAFDGIKNALAVGDTGMAIKIAFAGIKVAFINALAEMYRAVGIVIPKIWNVFKAVFNKIAELATNVMNTVIEAVKNPTKALEAYEKIKNLFKSDKGFGELGQEFLDGLAESAKQEFNQLTVEADMKARMAKMGKDSGNGIVAGAKEAAGNLVGGEENLPSMEDIVAGLGLPSLPAGMGGAAGAMPAMPDQSGVLADLQSQSNTTQANMESLLGEIAKNTAAAGNGPHQEKSFDFDINESVGAKGG